MNSKTSLLDKQRSWAAKAGKSVDARGYLASITENLFQPLSARALQAFSTGSGSELLDTRLRPAKMKALHSSAALAVNVFDYWAGQDPEIFLRALRLEPKPVSIDFEAQFPTGLGGNPPNLDIAFRYGGGLVVGVESKFSEWLTPKPPKKELFKPKYFPDSTGLWSARGLPGSQALATEVHAGRAHFRYLDVAQLLKHALGLATQHQGKFGLHYLFYEWPGPESLVHRAEIDRFKALVGSEFPFHWDSYQEVYKSLCLAIGTEHVKYTTYLGKRYFHDAVEPFLQGYPSTAVRLVKR